MDLFSELITAVQSDLTIGDESSLFPLDNVKSAINRSYRKAGGLFLWPETEDAKKTSSVDGQDYYDYPQNWRADSMWKLKVDGVRYGEKPDGSPLTFPDFLNFKEDNPNSTEKKWSTQWRRYFITPTPSSDGSNNICIWGQKVVEKMVENDDTTIFSYALPEGNEAIVLEAVAILKSKGEEEDKGQFRSAEAKQILIVAWGKIRANQAKYEKIEPFFDVPDFFAGNNRRRGRKDTNYGDF